MTVLALLSHVSLIWARLKLLGVLCKTQWRGHSMWKCFSFRGRTKSYSRKKAKRAKKERGKQCSLIMPGASQPCTWGTSRGLTCLLHRLSRSRSSQMTLPCKSGSKLAISPFHTEDLQSRPVKPLCGYLLVPILASRSTMTLNSIRYLENCAPTTLRPSTSSWRWTRISGFGWCPRIKGIGRKALGPRVLKSVNWAEYLSTLTSISKISPMAASKESIWQVQT